MSNDHRRQRRSGTNPTQSAAPHLNCAICALSADKSPSALSALVMQMKSAVKRRQMSAAAEIMNLRRSKRSLLRTCECQIIHFAAQGQNYTKKAAAAKVHITKTQTDTSALRELFSRRAEYIHKKRVSTHGLSCCWVVAPLAVECREVCAHAWYIKFEY
jgi:hypothetical protein